MSEVEPGLRGDGYRSGHESEDNAGEDDRSTNIG
jgi:hypothetical protein